MSFYLFVLLCAQLSGRGCNFVQMPGPAFSTFEECKDNGTLQHVFNKNVAAAGDYYCMPRAAAQTASN